MTTPHLRLAMPQPDGSLLLDFEDDTRRWIDADTAATLGLRDAQPFAAPDATTPDGLCRRDGIRVAARLLHAAARPATPAQEARARVTLVQARWSAGGCPRALDVAFDVFARRKALRIDDVVGAGMAADGYSSELDLDALADDAYLSGQLRECGAGWLPDALVATRAEDADARARAVLRAAWANGVAVLVASAVDAQTIDDEDAPRIVAASPARHAGASQPCEGAVGEGWWAPPGGDARWYETSRRDREGFADIVAIVARRMHENRADDGVPHATDLLLLPFGSNLKLRMFWFDPDRSEALDADEYTIVLHVAPDDEDFDADVFERLCRDAGQTAAEDPAYAGPQLHFRWEWGGAHWPLG